MVPEKLYRNILMTVSATMKHSLTFAGVKAANYLWPQITKWTKMFACRKGEKFMVNECTLFSKNVTTKIYLDSENIVSKHFYSFLQSFLFKLQLVYFLVVYSFQKVSAKSVWKVSGTRLFGSFQRKTSGSNGTSEKVVLFFRTECSNQKFVFHFVDTQFQAFAAFFR